MIKIKAPWSWIHTTVSIKNLTFHVTKVEVPDDMPVHVRETFTIDIVDTRVRWNFWSELSSPEWHVYLVFQDEGAASLFKLTYL